MDHVAPHLYQWLAQELQWDLYMQHTCMHAANGSALRLDAVPLQLTVCISMIFKNGPPQHARSYWPMSVSMGMRGILLRLVLNNLRDPSRLCCPAHKQGATCSAHGPEATPTC